MTNYNAVWLPDRNGHLTRGCSEYDHQADLHLCWAAYRLLALTTALTMLSSAVNHGEVLGLPMVTSG